MTSLLLLLLQEAPLDDKAISHSVLPSQLRQAEVSSGVAMLGLLLCLVAALQPVCRAYYAPDEVSTLPGMTFEPNYRQWSGYLQAGHGKFLHYW